MICIFYDHLHLYDHSHVMRNPIVTETWWLIIIMLGNILTPCYIKNDFHNWTVELRWWFSWTVPFRSVLFMETDHDGSVACGSNSRYAWWFLQTTFNNRLILKWIQMPRELKTDIVWTKQKWPNSSPLKCQGDLAFTSRVHFTMSILCISQYLGIFSVFFPDWSFITARFYKFCRRFLASISLSIPLVHWVFIKALSILPVATEGL